MLHLSDAELHVWKSPSDAADSPDFTVPAEDIEHVTITERAGRPLDTGTIRLNNANGRYSTPGGGTNIGVDDRVEFWVSTEEHGPGYDFGEGPFGEGVFGGGAATRVGSFIVTGGDISTPRWLSVLTLDIEDFVFNRLSEQTVRHSELARPISGSADAHLDMILTQFAPEIDRAYLPAITDTIDFFADGKSVNAVVSELAGHAQLALGTPVVTGSQDEALLFEPLADVEPAISSDSDDPLSLGRDADLSAPDASFGGGELANEVRVEGGIDDYENIDDSQETVTAFQPVTDTTRLTVRVDTRKSELSSVDLYTRPITGSDERVRVRFQSDSGAGAPVAPADPDSDIVDETADNPPEEGGGWQSIDLPAHTFGPKGNPWLLIEATGEDGVEVGVDGTGVPAYYVLFPKPVVVEVPDPASQRRYRRHQKTIQNNSLTTFEAARDRAQVELDRNAYPSSEFGPARALSVRAHNLAVGDYIELDVPYLRTVGDYLVVEREREYTAVMNALDTTLAFESAENYATF